MTSDRSDRELVDPQVHLILLDDSRLLPLLRYVERNLHVWLTLERAAQIVSLEPTYFSSEFRRVTGCTFRDWNRAIRIERAKRSLQKRGSTVLSIALSVGYRDLTTFERAFKKCVGMSPSAYRAKYVPPRRPARSRRKRNP